MIRLSSPLVGFVLGGLTLLVAQAAGIAPFPGQTARAQSQPEIVGIGYGGNGAAIGLTRNGDLYVVSESEPTGRYYRSLPPADYVDLTSDGLTNYAVDSQGNVYRLHSGGYFQEVTPQAGLLTSPIVDMVFGELLMVEENGNVWSGIDRQLVYVGNFFGGPVGLSQSSLSRMKSAYGSSD